VWIWAAVDFIRMRKVSKVAADTLIGTPMYSRIPLTRRAVLVKFASPWVLGWLLFVSAWAVGFGVIGDLRRALAVALGGGVNALLYLVLVPAGYHASVLAGSPALPLVRGARRGWSGIRGRIRGPVPVFLFSALLLIPVVFTAFIYATRTLAPTPRVMQALEVETHAPAETALFVVFMLITAAVDEELVFRHYLLNRLTVAFGARQSRVLAPVSAVVLTTALFMLGHREMMDPAWLKYTQIALLGTALGVCQLRLGLECCIVLHLFFNISALAIATGTALTSM
jgi:membrane protease YdiL (CAAX protease family)